MSAERTLTLEQLADDPVLGVWWRRLTAQATVAGCLCPGCARPLRSYALFGIWFSADGAARTAYLLCEACAELMKREPEGMATRLELRFRNAEGRA